MSKCGKKAKTWMHGSYRCRWLEGRTCQMRACTHDTKNKWPAICLCRDFHLNSRHISINELRHAALCSCVDWTWWIYKGKKYDMKKMDAFTLQTPWAKMWVRNDILSLPSPPLEAGKTWVESLTDIAYIMHMLGDALMLIALSKGMLVIFQKVHVHRSFSAA